MLTYGEDHNTQIHAGGNLIVKSGGYSNRANVYGSMTIEAGATTDWTITADGARTDVYGTVSHVNAWKYSEDLTAQIFVYAGGRVNGADLYDWGTMDMYNGSTISGYSQLSGDARINFYGTVIADNAEFEFTYLWGNPGIAVFSNLNNLVGNYQIAIDMTGSVGVHCVATGASNFTGTIRVTNTGNGPVNLAVGQSFQFEGLLVSLTLTNGNLNLVSAERIEVIGSRYTVYAGQTKSGITIGVDGIVDAYGTTIDSNIGYGGSEYVKNGGVSDSDYIGGGAMVIEAGGRAFDGHMQGGQIEVYGRLDNFLIEGGDINIYNGATITTHFDIDDGYANIYSGVTIESGITFMFYHGRAIFHDQITVNNLQFMLNHLTTSPDTIAIENLDNVSGTYSITVQDPGQYGGTQYGSFYIASGSRYGTNLHVEKNGQLFSVDTDYVTYYDGAYYIVVSENNDLVRLDKFAYNPWSWNSNSLSDATASGSLAGFDFGLDMGDRDIANLGFRFILEDGTIELNYGQVLTSGKYAGWGITLSEEDDGAGQLRFAKLA